jgi:hypothetical protein
MAKGGGGNGMMRGPAGQQPPYQGGSFGPPSGMPVMRGPIPPKPPMGSFTTGPGNLGDIPPQKALPGLYGPQTNAWANAIQGGAGLAGGMAKPPMPPGGFAPGNLGDIPAGKSMPDFGALRQRMAGLGAMSPQAIPFNKAMPDFSGAVGAATNRMGGDNNYAQMLQQTKANPAYQNTVMNKLRPTMASNQNVQPLQVTNPRQASAGRNPAMQRVAQLRKTHQYGF